MITHDEVSITSHYRTVPTVARFIRTLRLGSSTDIKIKMTLTSKYPDVRIPDNVSWPEFVFQNFDKYGEDIALVDGIADRQCTFSQLETMTTSIASALARRGFKKGDVFGMYSPNSPEYAIVLFSVLKAGGIVTPVNPTFTGYEASVQLKMAGAKWLMTTSGLAHRAMEASQHAGIESERIITNGEVVEGCLLLSELIEDDGSSFPNVYIDPREDVALLPFSTETIGGPRVAMLTHFNLVANACISCSRGFVSFNRDSVVLAFVPFSHVYSLVVLLSVGLQCGSLVVTAPRFKQDKFLPLLERHGVTHLTITPPTAQFLANHPSVDRYNLTSLTDVSSGTVPLGRELAEAVTSRLPFIGKIRQGYGTPELSAVSHMTYMDSDSSNSGTLLPNLECKIVDIDSKKAVGEGTNGEICVRGPIVMKGYLNAPTAARHIIDTDGWLYTGDIGYCDKDQQLHVVDKGREVIRYKSYRVSPAELEGLLLSHSSTLEAAVIGVPDPTAGEVPKAFVVTKPDVKVTESDLIDFVEENVATYKKLRGGVEIIEEIPKSKNGTVIREALLNRPRQKDISRLTHVKNRRSSLKHGYLYAKNIHNNVIHQTAGVSSKACVIL